MEKAQNKLALTIIIFFEVEVQADLCWNGEIRLVEKHMDGGPSGPGMPGNPNTLTEQQRSQLKRIQELVQASDFAQGIVNALAGEDKAKSLEKHQALVGGLQLEEGVQRYINDFSPPGDEIDRSAKPKLAWYGQAFMPICFDENPVPESTIYLVPITDEKFAFSAALLLAEDNGEVKNPLSISKLPKGMSMVFMAGMALNFLQKDGTIGVAKLDDLRQMAQIAVSNIREPQMTVGDTEIYKQGVTKLLELFPVMKPNDISV